jgi:hypothetical protein
VGASEISKDIDLIIQDSGVVLQVVRGAKGDAGPEIQIQYSPEVSTGWTDTYTGNEKYMRMSTDNGVTWGDALLIKSDLSGAEIKTLYEAEEDTNAYTDEEKTKLSDIAENANNYSHPASHSLDMITETTELKVMTSDERIRLSTIGGIPI